MSRLKRLVLLLKTRQLGLILKLLRQKVYSGSNFFCLRLDLTESFEAPTAKISLTVRPIQKGEAENLFDATAPGLSAAEVIDRTGEWNSSDWDSAVLCRDRPERRPMLCPVAQ